MTIKDFKVGQLVYIYLSGSNVRRYINSDNINDYIKRAVVIKVGRRYVTVRFQDSRHTEMFDAQNSFIQKTAYSEDYEIFLTVQDIYNKVLSANLRTKIRQALDSYVCNERYTVEQLQTVCDILNIK